MIQAATQFCYRWDADGGITFQYDVLHYPGYRAHWLGTLASISGFQIVRFARVRSMYEPTATLTRP